MSMAAWLGGTEGEEQTLGEYLVEHMKDTPEWHAGPLNIHLPQFPKFEFFGLQFDMSITAHLLMMWFACAILTGVFYFAFRKQKLVPSGFAAILESLVLFIRDEIAIANMGEKDGKKYTPFLATLFLFILTLNLMGLIPIFVTATSNFSVTMGLAIFVFAMTNVGGIRANGVWGHFKGIVPHVPGFLMPMMIPLEVFLFIVKHAVLAIRLFANMTAGHTVILALLGLIVVMQTYLVSPVSIGLALFINFLELLVAFIQTYVFTLLAAVFIGSALHPDH